MYIIYSYFTKGSIDRGGRQDCTSLLIVFKASKVGCWEEDTIFILLVFYLFTVLQVLYFNLFNFSNFSKYIIKQCSWKRFYFLFFGLTTKRWMSVGEFSNVIYLFIHAFYKIFIQLSDGMFFHWKLEEEIIKYNCFTKLSEN